MTKRIYIVVGCLLCVLSSAHVVLIHPVPRTNNDYLYSFEETVCNPTIQSCNAFCGDALGPDNYPVTTLQAGVEQTIYWSTNVAHSPYQYRFSLNYATADDNFDNAENILTIIDNSEAAFPTNQGLTGTFSANITIPLSAIPSCTTDSPCVLQLWDLYYFVSCANIVLTEDTVVVPDLPVPSAPPAGNGSVSTSATTSILVQADSFQDYRVTVGGDSNAALDPVLYLQRCVEYTFRVDAPGHPFVLKTQPGIGLDHLIDWSSSYYESSSGSIPTAANQGIEMGTFTFRATRAAPVNDTLYYQCTLHENMVSTIVIVDSPGEDNVDECAEEPSSSAPNPFLDMASTAWKRSFPVAAAFALTPLLWI